MGIGEPFENYDEMMDFLRIVNDDNSLNIGARHITVSTSGIILEFMISLKKTSKSILQLVYMVLKTKFVLV